MAIGNRSRGRLRTGDASDFTARTMAEVTRRLLAGAPSPGAHTPGGLFGPELAEAVGATFVNDDAMTDTRSPGPKGAIYGSSLKNNEVGPAIFEAFLPQALADGRYIAAPGPSVSSATASSPSKPGSTRRKPGSRPPRSSSPCKSGDRQRRLRQGPVRHNSSQRAPIRRVEVLRGDSMRVRPGRRVGA